MISCCQYQSGKRVYEGNFERYFFDITYVVKDEARKIETVYTRLTNSYYQYNATIIVAYEAYNEYAENDVINIKYLPSMRSKPISNLGEHVSSDKLASYVCIGLVWLLQFGIMAMLVLVMYLASPDHFAINFAVSFGIGIVFLIPFKILQHYFCKR